MMGWFFHCGSEGIRMQPCEELPYKKPTAWVGLLYGTPRGIRTPDLLVRSQTLYPAELAVLESRLNCPMLSYFYNIYYCL